jgi:hypothetical protein
MNDRYHWTNMDWIDMDQVGIEDLREENDYFCLFLLISKYSPALFEQLFRGISQDNPAYDVLQIHCSRFNSSI